MPKVIFDLTLSTTYSPAWSGSVTNPDSNLTASSVTPGAASFSWHQEDHVSSGDRNVGANIKCDAVGTASGTVNLAVIPSVALITQLRVTMQRSGHGYSTHRWEKLSGGGTTGASPRTNTQLKITAAAAGVAENVIDDDATSGGAGSIPPAQPPVYIESESTLTDSIVEKITGFASITKAAFITAHNNDLAVSVGNAGLASVTNCNASWTDAWGSQPFLMVFKVDKTIDGTIAAAYKTFELTYTGVTFSLTPSSGPYYGGTTVVITGIGFTGASSVMFGAQSAGFVFVSDTRIDAISPPVPLPTTVTVSVVIGGITIEIGPFTYDPAGDYWGTEGAGGEGRKGKILIVSPNVGTNYSRGKTVTMVTGTPLANYPATKLVDDSADSPLRISEQQFDFYIDLGVSRTPDVVALINHNLDSTVLIQVLAGEDPSLAGTVGAFAAGNMNGWLDLRTMPFRTGRYWKIRTAIANSVPITVGEIVIGTAYQMEGVLNENWVRGSKYFIERAYTEEMLPYKMHSGALARVLQLNFVLDPANRTIIETVFDDAGITGNRVVVIPHTGKNEVYFIDWPSQRSLNFPESLRQATISLLLPEQSAGVS